jgi:hypothetical protein
MQYLRQKYDTALCTDSDLTHPSILQARWQEVSGLETKKMTALPEI